MEFCQPEKVGTLSLVISMTFIFVTIKVLLSLNES